MRAKTKAGWVIRRKADGLYFPAAADDAPWGALAGAFLFPHWAHDQIVASPDQGVVKAGDEWVELDAAGQITTSVAPTREWVPPVRKWIVVMLGERGELLMRVGPSPDDWLPAPSEADFCRAAMYDEADEHVLPFVSRRNRRRGSPRKAASPRPVRIPVLVHAFGSVTLERPASAQHCDGPCSDCDGPPPTPAPVVAADHADSRN